MFAACSPEDEAEDRTGDVADADECATEDLPLKSEGVLTIGTDSPAFEPWFVDNDPTNGKGYESAVAYAVAEELGFSRDQVKWITVGFNSLFKPGGVDFDFDINQTSITPNRDEVVDLSEGYYSAAQAVITLEDSPAASAASLEDLKAFKLGAQTGTTSLTAIRDIIQPDQEPLVFEDTNVAKQAMQNGQVDAILADLPTAFYISAVEIPRQQADRTVPAGDRRAGGVRDPVRAGERAAAVRQPRAADAEGRRNDRRHRAAVALRRGERPSQ